MNSTQGYKGFITFLILAGITLTVLVGFKYINSSTNISSKASQDKEELLIPKRIEIYELESHTAKIRWVTDSEAFTEIIYSTRNDLCDFTPDVDCKIIVGEDLVRSHSLSIDNLREDTTYYYKIKAGDVWFPEDTQLTFRTRKNDNPIDKEDESPKKDTPTEAVSPTPPVPTTPTAPDEADKEGDDFDGFSDPVPAKTEPPDTPTSIKTQSNDSLTADPNTDDHSGFGATESDGVLGVSFNLLDHLITEEFDEALEYNDSNYDFNHDGEVTMLDYPLFIHFITSQGD